MSNKETRYEMQDSLICPKCSTGWPDKTVICVECGYNFQTGRKQKTVYKVRDHAWWASGGSFIGTHLTLQKTGPNRLNLKVDKYFFWFHTRTKSVSLKNYFRILTSWSSTEDLEFWTAHLEHRNGSRIHLITSSEKEEYLEIVDLVSEITGFEIVPAN